MLSLTTALCRMLQINYPIIQAGMAGGITPPSLVAHVSNAGGLGTLGAGYMSPDSLQTAIQEIKKQTKYPFGVNIFKVEMTNHDPRYDTVQSKLNEYRKQVGLSPAVNGANVANLYQEQLDVILQEHVPVVSTTFGLPSPEDLVRMKEDNIKVLTMVTTVNEAKMAEERGVDVIVAQGYEAGGHRGTFSVTNDAHDLGKNVGTMALVPQVVDAVDIPVIAAGGIMDGRGLVASLALGAQGIQLGTRFLTASESTAHPRYQEVISQSSETSTVITKSFSGRPARGVLNTFIKDFEASGLEPLAYPIQNLATSDIRKAAKDTNNPEYMSLWAGQATRLIKQHQTAEEIILDIINEAKRILG